MIIFTIYNRCKIKRFSLIYIVFWFYYYTYQLTKVTGYFVVRLILLYFHLSIPKSVKYIVVKCCIFIYFFKSHSASTPFPGIFVNYIKSNAT